MNIATEQLINKNNAETKTGERNYASPQDKFILPDFEHHLRAQLNREGFTISETKSRTSKELEICRGNKVVAYISRKTALTQGQLVLCIHPENTGKLDSYVRNLVNIEPRSKPKGRYISSSNYKGFNSKGFCENVTSKEHIATAYTVTITADNAEMFELLNQL